MVEKIALLYCRVSTGRQAETGHSLESQAGRLRQEAEAQGFQVEIVIEIGSGRKTARPKLNEALDRLNRGEAQALFALDLDRLSRSTRHALELLDLAKRKGWRLVIATLNIDTETPIGEMMASQLAIYAQFESRMTGERVKRQHQARRDRGITWGLDQGYKGNLNPATRALIASLSAQGKSLRSIAEHLTERTLETPRGGKWHAETVRAILKSPQTLLAERAN
jgi:hypothetical protein